jgi:hypothetical protein
MREVKQKGGKGVLHVREKGDPPLPNAGRPKQLITLLLEDLKAEGYEQITPLQIVQVFSYLLVLDVPRLLAITEDETQPIIFRKTAQKLLTKEGFEIIEKVIRIMGALPMSATNPYELPTITLSIVKQHDVALSEFTIIDE